MEITKAINDSKVLRFIITAFIGTIFLTISAKIKIPFYPVPMTMQTFVVLFMGIAFGWKIGVATNTNYLFIFFKLIFSVSLIYILGMLWLGNLIGWDKPIFSIGATPFLLAELFKIVLLTLLTKVIVNLRKFI